MIKRGILLLTFLAMVTTRHVDNTKRGNVDEQVEKLSEEVSALKQIVLKQAEIIHDL